MLTETAQLSKKLVKGLSAFALTTAFVFVPFMANAEGNTPIAAAPAKAKTAKELDALAKDVTKTAQKYLGVQYQEGGITPKGFDASGYTQYVFDESKADIKLPRSSKDQFKAGTAVNQKDIKEGDLLFFKTNSKSKDVSFVGISLGKDQFIAVTSSKGVSINSLNTKYWKDTYAGAKRVLK